MLFMLGDIYYSVNQVFRHRDNFPTDENTKLDVLV